MSLSRPLHRLPAYVINGIAVALGVAAIQALTAAVGGAGAALVASTGAICASLADVPLSAERTWRRVLAAAAIACVAGALTEWLRPHPLVLGVFVALLAFASNMALAWGPRAGPISFVGLLAFIFTMAAPPVAGWRAQIEHLGWMACGAALYLAWSSAASALLQRRYRALALAGALEATADLLRARAVLLARAAASGGGTDALRDWIRVEVRLDERLQAARDLLFTGPDDPRTRRQAALLVCAIDLRDTLLASELDLDVLGRDPAGLHVRAALAARLDAMADAVAELERAARFGTRVTDEAEGGAIGPMPLGAIEFPAGDARERLVPVLHNRARQLRRDLDQMRALALGRDLGIPLDRDELRLFVSVEGWPLAALRPHARLGSPVLRHALRAGLALGTAYFIGIALPWASHPFWLVLSVAVVLRVNLEQTLARRNGRVLGTALGCLFVLGLAQLHVPWLATVVLIAAVGTAHAYVTTRYIVTAAAASVMALLQAHLANPGAGFAVPERLADTVLGALLAWAFSYVLPSWERRAMPRTVTRVERALAELARQTLRWPDGDTAQVKLRLARREVYEALGVLAAAAQRTAVEPEGVRVPLEALAALLRHSHALLAHLAAARALLARRSGEMERAEGVATLEGALADIGGQLEARRGAGAVELIPDEEPPGLPAGMPAVALQPWLERRLRLARRSAARVRASATELHGLARA